MKSLKGVNYHDQPVSTDDALILLGISHVLSSSSEAQSLTILSRKECRRRLTLIHDELKTERYCLGFGNKIPTNVECYGEVNSLLTEFNEPQQTKATTKTDLSAIVQKFEPIYDEFTKYDDDENVIERENKLVETTAGVPGPHRGAGKFFQRLRQQLIAKMNMIASRKDQVECTEEFTKGCQGKLLKKKRLRKNGKITKSRGSPIPLLGRAIQKKFLTARKYHGNHLNNVFRKKKEYDCTTEKQENSNIKLERILF